MINREIFYQEIRSHIFNGSLRQSQVDGIDAILNDWEKRHFTDIRWLAYMLGTTYHETAKTMEPIEEWKKGMNKKYGIPDKQTGQKYYGRGFVQLTWRHNYERAKEELGVDLVWHPELALDLTIATEIMFEGMIAGWFTGKRLSHFFDGTKGDWRNARKIINGLDKADLIANYSKEFYNALLMAQSS